MQIVIVGVNQRTAPLEVREPLGFPDDQLTPALAHLRATVDEAFILSTCNRVEICGFVGHADSGSQHLLTFLAQSRGVPPELLRRHAYTHAHDAAVRHLFRVSAGIDSMVLGEDQILGQLRSALERARSEHALGTVLHRLGSAALAVGKRVRSDTAISRNPVSVVSIGLQAARDALGGLRDRRVVVLGAGRTAEVAVQHLATAGTARVDIISRGLHHAVALAGAYGAGAHPWTGLESVLAGADLVIACTSAPMMVLDAATVVRARPTGRRLLCLDLAVPRDIDPAVGELPGVTLIDIDRLRSVADANRELRGREVHQAEAVVDDGVEKYMDWWRARQVVPTIAALRARADGIRDAELQRARGRLAGLSEHDQLAVRTLATRIVNKLLHQPITALKTDPEGANMAQIVQQLFGLAEEDGHGCPSRGDAARADAAPAAATPAAAATAAAAHYTSKEPM